MNAIIGYCRKRKLLSIDDASQPSTSIVSGVPVTRTASTAGPSTNIRATTTEDIYPRNNEGRNNQRRASAWESSDDDASSQEDESDEANEVNETDHSPDFEDEWQDQSQNIPFWPCPSCIPGNTTGYTCPDPIPIPTDGSLIAAPAAFQQMPSRGVRRPLLSDLGGQW